jgi:Right handed beta helix region
MKKQTIHPVQAHLVHGAFYLVLLLAVCAIPFALAQRNATKQMAAKHGDALPANIILVTNTDDSGPGSLRDALAIANDGDTIDAAGISGTILLTSGELQINDNVTINGPGAENLAVDGDATFRVFENFASNVTISGFTITNGLVADGNGGGGILNHGGLTLSDSIISSNFAGPLNTNGGGINTAGGTLTVANSTISGNHCTGGGGGIWGTDGATVTVSGSAINGNGGCAGGGIDVDDAQLTVTNSTISGNGISGPCQGGPGGGIALGNGTLTMTNTTISDNSAGGVPNGIGGGMFLFGNGTTATITDSTISNNSTGSDGGGGGVFNVNGMLTVNNTTISGNSTVGPGGGIGNIAFDGSATLMITNSTISGNSAVDGGGVYSGAGGSVQSFSVVTISSSTISGNSAGAGGNGGGIRNGANDANGATLMITNSTLSGNSAGNGGGIYNSSQQGGVAGLDLGSTILNAGGSGENIVNNAGTVTSHGYNLSSDDGGGYLTGAGDQIKTDPTLGALQDNGGPTFTHEVLPGSPAIDTGDPSFTPPPFYDQRGLGFDRVVNGRIDIGSFEVQGPTATPTPTATATSTATATPTATPRATPRPRPTPHPRPTSGRKMLFL